MCMIDAVSCQTEFHRETYPTARKTHSCENCFRKIKAGEKYRYTSMKQEGDFFTAKECIHCVEAVKLLVRHCGGYLFGAVAEDLEEHIHESLPWSNQAARAYVGVKRKWMSYNSDGLLPVPNFPIHSQSAGEQ